MYKLIMLLLLVSCSVDKREAAFKLANDSCSCYGGIEFITFTEDAFHFICKDYITYGIEVAYGSLYYGDVCEKK